MDNPSAIQQSIQTDGFAIIENIFTDDEIKTLLDNIAQVETTNANFRKTNDLFAIRQFLKEIPSVASLIFNDRLKKVIANVFGEEYFAVKSIYFDKPEQSNWFVAYHQDLTISVDKKSELPGFGPWTVKQNQFAVQPPVGILADNFTIRIHLDDTDQSNGALKVIAGSHRHGIVRTEEMETISREEHICEVGKGGTMIMRPLLLHASGRTTNGKKRRVIHIEFSRTVLPDELQWSEKMPIDFDKVTR